jgi:hypothetical protein
MNDHVLTAKLRQAVTAVAEGQLGLVILGPIHVTRGWGDILFVRVYAQLQGTSPDAREIVEHRFQAAVREALDGNRTSVSVTWSNN